jgi:flagellar biosynthesis/type III secretory pathway protein FliH
VLSRIFPGKEAEEMALTLAEELKLEGRAEGEARGRMKGKAEGKAEGEAIGEARGEAIGKMNSLVSVLTARFGKVPVSLEKRITGIKESDRIEKLTFFAATCDSLEAFKKGM